MERGEEENQGLPSHLHHHVSCRHGNGKEMGAQKKVLIPSPKKKKGFLYQNQVPGLLMGKYEVDNAIDSVPSISGYLVVFGKSCFLKPDKYTVCVTRGKMHTLHGPGLHEIM